MVLKSTQAKQILLRVDITLQEDTSTCATGQTSDPVPIYINVPNIVHR